MSEELGSTIVDEHSSELESSTNTRYIVEKAATVEETASSTTEEDSTVMDSIAVDDTVLSDDPNILSSESAVPSSEDLVDASSFDTADSDVDLVRSVTTGDASIDGSALADDGDMHYDDLSDSSSEEAAEEQELDEEEPIEKVYRHDEPWDDMMAHDSLLDTFVNDASSILEGLDWGESSTEGDEKEDEDNLEPSQSSTSAASSTTLDANQTLPSLTVPKQTDPLDDYRVEEDGPNRVWFVGEFANYYPVSILKELGVRRAARHEQWCWRLFVPKGTTPRTDEILQALSSKELREKALSEPQVWVRRPPTARMDKSATTSQVDEKITDKKGSDEKSSDKRSRSPKPLTLSKKDRSTREARKMPILQTVSVTVPEPFLGARCSLKGKMSYKKARLGKIISLTTSSNPTAVGVWECTIQPEWGNHDVMIAHIQNGRWVMKTGPYAGHEVNLGTFE